MAMSPEDIPHIVVAVLKEVHGTLGPGYHIEAYRECFAHELRMHELLFARAAPGFIEYKGARITLGFTMDFLVEDLVIVHLHAVERLEACHKNSLKTQLRTTGLETGLLVNFNVPDLRKGGIQRIIVSYVEPSSGWKSADDDDEFEAEQERSSRGS